MDRRIILMLGLMRIHSYIGMAAMLLAGCSKSLPPDTSALVLAANQRGAPQFQLSGPGVLNYNYSSGSFTFHIGPAAGAPWISGSGQMKLGSSNDVAIAIQSSSDRPYDIQLFGLATNSDMSLSEDQLKETLHVSKGDQKLKIDRFVIYTYDFTKR